MIFTDHFQLKDQDGAPLIFSAAIVRLIPTLWITSSVKRGREGRKNLGIGDQRRRKMIFNSSDEVHCSKKQQRCKKSLILITYAMYIVCFREVFLPLVRIRASHVQFATVWKQGHDSFAHKISLRIPNDCGIRGTGFAMYKIELR